MNGEKSDHIFNRRIYVHSMIRNFRVLAVKYENGDFFETPG